MKSRDELQFSIENLLIIDDALFESLTEEETDSFARYCIEEDPGEFERCIEILLKDYNRILIKARLLENEHDMIEKSRYLQEHVQIFNTRFAEILDRLNQRMLDSRSMLSALGNQDRAYELKTAAELKVRAALNDVSSIEMSIIKTRSFIEQWSIDTKNLHHTIIEDAKKTLEDLREQLKMATEKAERLKSEAANAEQHAINADNTANTIINSSNVEDVKNKITAEQDNASIYNFPIFTMQLIQVNMLNQLQQLSQQSGVFVQQGEAMAQITQNLGIIKIQQRLEFCMNIILAVPYTSLFIEQDSTSYSFITKSFGEFLYLHGEDLYLVEETTEKGRVHRKNLQSLVFYFMSVDIEDLAQVKLCLTQTFKDISNTKQVTLIEINLPLEDFAKKYPREFIQLYKYLFDTDNLFSEQINQLIEQKHVFVMYNMALFNLYLSIAYQQVNKTVNFEKFRSQSTRGLLTAFAAGINDAEYWIVKYFYNDINVKIKLAVVYFEFDMPGQHELSSILFDYFKKNMFEMDTAMSELFSHWMIYRDNEIRQYSARLIISLSLNDPAAWSVLLRNADFNVEYAVMAATIALSGDHSMKHQALQKLMFHPNQLDRDISFSKFIIIKDLLNEFHAPALVTAAKQKHEQACSLLIANYDSNQALRQEIHSQITNALENKPVYLLNLLKDLYLKKSPIVSEYDIDSINFFNIFFSFLSRSLNSKQEAGLLENLNHYASKKYLNAYDALLCYAKNNVKAAFILAKNLYAENPQNHMVNEYVIKLITFFKQYCEDNTSSEKQYSLFILEKHAGGKTNPDYLIASCEEAYLPAVLEMDMALNSNPCSLDILRIENYKRLLHNLTVTLNSCTSAAAEALCIRYFSERNYSKADLYFEICTDIHQICRRLEKEKCMKAFLNTCNKKIFELIPEEFKSQDFGQVSVKSRISLFQNMSQATLRQEKPQLSQATMGL